MSGELLLGGSASASASGAAAVTTYGAGRVGDHSHARAMPTVADVAVPSHLSFVYSQATRLVSDAIAGRNPNHVASAKSLAVARVLYSSSAYQALYFVCCALLLAIGQVERPATYGPQSSYNRGYPALELGWLCGIEIALLALFAVDVYLRAIHLGWARFKKSTWPMTKLVCVALSVINILAVFAAPDYVPRFYRALRPLFVVAHYTHVQQILGNIARTVGPVAKISTLIVFHVLFFGVLAYFLFSGFHFMHDSFEPDGVTQKVCCGEDWCADLTLPNTTHPDLCSPFSRDTCSDYFGRVPSALNEMFVLLTTANYPDVMMPAYRCQPASSLFFVIFLSVGLFFVMNLVLAVAVSAFQDSTKAKVLQMITKRIQCSDKAYALLLDAARAPGDAAVARDGSVQSRDTGVGRVEFYRLLALLRRGNAPVHSSWTLHELEVIFRAVNASGTGKISRDEFRSVANYAEVRVRRELHGNADEYANLGAAVLAIRQWLRPVVTAPRFQAVFDALVYVTGLLVFAELCVDSSSTTFKALDGSLEVVLWVFVGEVTAKLLGMGAGLFFEDGFNTLDFFVIYSAAIFDIYEYTTPAADNFSRQLAYLRLLRLLRTLRSLKGFAVIVKTLTTIAPFFARYLAVSLCIFYVFAVIGMEAFAGRIHDALQAVAASPYGQSQYWGNSFDTLLESLVTLFELAIVNNWAVVMIGHVAATSAWAMAFFYAWFFVIVVVVLNIVTAFLLDDFDVVRAEFEAEQQGIVPAWKQTVRDCIAQADIHGFSGSRLTITRKRHGFQVYETLFADEIDEFVRQLSKERRDMAGPLPSEVGDEESRGARRRSVAAQAWASAAQQVLRAKGDSRV